MQESHCTPVLALAFNTLDAQCGNLFATVGKDQATVYDDLHMGDFIGVVVHFINQATPHTMGGVRPTHQPNTQLLGQEAVFVKVT